MYTSIILISSPSPSPSPFSRLLLLQNSNYMIRFLIRTLFTSSTQQIFGAQSKGEVEIPKRERNSICPAVFTFLVNYYGVWVSAWIFPENWYLQLTRNTLTYKVFFLSRLHGHHFVAKILRIFLRLYIFLEQTWFSVFILFDCLSPQSTTENSRKSQKIIRLYRWTSETMNK